MIDPDGILRTQNRSLGMAIVQFSLSDLEESSTMLFAADYPGRYYVQFYIRYFSEYWDNMTPAGYAGLLVFVGVCGYLLMRSAH
jgi:hypothetical protein